MKQIILTSLITGSFFYCCKIGQIPTNEVNITLIDSITILNHQIDKLPEIYRDHQYFIDKEKIQIFSKNLKNGIIKDLNFSSVLSRTVIFDECCAQKSIGKSKNAILIVFFKMEF